MILIKNYLTAYNIKKYFCASKYYYIGIEVINFTIYY